jgi:hypothetical protein
MKPREEVEMLLPMPPADLDHVVKARQAELRGERRLIVKSRTPVRVRVGRALIAAGTAMGGERAEQPARPSSLRRAARSAC